MKNIFKITTIAIMCLTASVVRADDGDFYIKSKSESEKTISFQINEAKDFSLSILNENNDVLFEQKLQAVAISTKTYDLNALPEGKYIMKVESGSKLAQYQVVIAGNKAIFSAPKITEVIKPVITKEKGGIINLDFDYPQAGAVEVKVYNDSNDELYSEVFKDRSKISKKFNVNRADSNDVTFIVKYEDQTFVKTIAAR